MKILQFFGFQESPDFKNLDSQLKRKQQIKPAGSQDHPSYTAINPRSHWVYLRSAIEEAQTGKPVTENPQGLTNLIGSKAQKQFQKIVSSICHKHAGYRDPSAGELKQEIDNWIAQVNNTNDPKVDKAARLFFGLLADSVNLDELHAIVENFAQRHKFTEKPIAEQKKLRKLFLQSYQAKYPVSAKELLRLFNTITGVAEPFSYWTMRTAMHKIYEDAGITTKDRWRALIGTKLFLGSSCHAAGPYALNYDVATMPLAPGAHFTGSKFTKSADLAILEQVRKINKATNNRIANSALTRAFEFDGDKHFGELFSVLMRGKKAQEELICKMQTTIPGSAMDIFTSLGALATINPTLAGISMLSMPAIYFITKKTGEEIQDTNALEGAAQAKGSNALNERVQGREAIVTSPSRPDVITDIETRLNQADELSLKNSLQAIGLSYQSMDVFLLATFASLATGSAMYWYDPSMIKHSDLTANAFYTQRVQFPFKRLLETYYTEVPQLIQDIQRMNQVLEQTEALNTADRAAEAERIPVAEALRDGHDISIQNLHWKGILKGVNLEIPGGDIVGIVGTSGTGKSSLIKSMVGINKPNKGSVNIGGHNFMDIKQDGPESIYTALAYSNQFPVIFNDINLRDNLLLWSVHNPGDEKIQALLEELGLGKFKDKLDSNDFHFSGGERARIGIARALLKNPKILILDEPTAGLDEKTTRDFMQIIRHIKRPSTTSDSNPYENTTIVCVTQDVTLREELAKLAQEQKKTGIIDIADTVRKPMSPQEYFAQKRSSTTGKDPNAV